MKSLIIALFMSSVLIMSCTAAKPSSKRISSANADNPKYVNGNAGVDISADDLRMLERRALLYGDGFAALTLENYYKLWLDDQKMGAFWRTIALENGSHQAMLLESHELASSNDSRAWLRARYLLNVLVKSDDYRRAAQDELDSLNKKGK